MIYYFKINFIIAGYIKNFLTNLEYIRICLSRKILSLETLKKKSFYIRANNFQELILSKIIEAA